MTVADPRFHPLIELDAQHLRDMAAPVSGGAALREAVMLDGGMVNTVYRLTLARSAGTLVLRVYPPDTAAAIRAEQRLLRSIGGELPVPEMIWSDPRGELAGHPYTIYRWIEGITLNEYRRGAAPGELALLGGPLGEVLGRISLHAYPDGLVARPAAAEVELARERLRAGLVRERLGDEIAFALDDLLAGAPELEGGPVLVHGDFGGRNVLVTAGPDGPWRITAVLDWDSAAIGSPLWDVGSFFRYSTRYDEAFREAFAEGYRAAGGELPADWWRAARLLDATCLVSILEDPRPLTRVFAECRLVLLQLLQDHGLLD